MIVRNQHVPMASMSDLDALDDLLPQQRVSAHGERLELVFGARVRISLTVDAGPGCGGLAWPAGEVRIA